MLSEPITYNIKKKKKLERVLFLLRIYYIGKKTPVKYKTN